MGSMEDEKLPLTTHLEELRKRLIRVLVVVGLGFVACYALREQLFTIITQPLAAVLPKGSHMIFTGLPEAFFIYMKIAFFASLFLTSPYIFYQIWCFIAPGLYPQEKRHVVPFVLSSTLLFIAGVLFGYYVALPPAFEFFVAFATDFLKPMISFREYLSFSLKMLLAFGLSFELPVFIFFLARLGIVNARMLRKQRRYAILVIFIAAAFLTPSPDAFSQILMAAPLMLLYEISVFLARYAEKKRARQAVEADEGDGNDGD
jgi:sec-independent protein translocase protein TatC